MQPSEYYSISYGRSLTYTLLLFHMRLRRKQRYKDY